MFNNKSIFKNKLVFSIVCQILYHLKKESFAMNFSDSKC